MKAYLYFVLGFLVIAAATIYNDLMPPTYEYYEYYIFRDHLPVGKDKKLTVFGATGNIGHAVVKNALAYGFNVTAYAKNSSKTFRKNSHLHVVYGDYVNIDQMKKAIEGSVAVISCIGPEYSKTATHNVSIAHKNIIKAVEQTNVTRFITISTPAYKYKEDKMNFYINLYDLYATKLYPEAYKEHIRMAKDTEESSLNWTVVRYMKPTDDPAYGRILINHGENKTNPFVSREDISSFILSNINENLFAHDMPIIGR
ncbi:oxidoreductase, putative [Trichomonas vaginalis G3]|uniref:Oxidoreductase, putative n=1 Tax=Trichomonas vaginalis (strain ATCC PRA-98 / G3) TaxID=412133 RepID=A2G6A3_TRIV3|nr:BVR-B (biliverdin IX beta reductase B)-like domain-containing protein [Trichomonas vaginalis G3]EAX87314.1 oxidoreductase, putative [Trichomonas vaginalis G3]KAI5522810.1 BVR-B (biliverdin IX beta reductase B)-like domain-containing protein [Trichomonas vaginalis G3]|eukprot:XP_001300244.1 oxidoreductase [Trichomonas vaginalis G3]